MVNSIINVGKTQNVYSLCSMRYSPWWVEEGIFQAFVPFRGWTLQMSCLVTKPTMCAQWRLRSAWTSSQSDQSLLSAWRKLGYLATHWAYSEGWSDWADAQADLSLRWAQSHFVGFVMALGGSNGLKYRSYLYKESSISVSVSVAIASTYN